MTQNEKNLELDGLDDAVLDSFFSAAKGADPVPSADLMARVLADASHIQKERTQQVRRPLNQPKRRFLLADLFGGWAGVSTLAAGVCLGVFIGLSSPDEIISYVSGLDATLSDDGFGLYFDEEL